MIDATSRLDVRNLQPAERDSKVLSAFESLEDGGALELTDDREPRHVLKQLEARHPGTVEWSSLEAGPVRYRTQIRRRPASASRTVSDYLGFDHRRLDGILPDVTQRVANADFAVARERFAEFTCGLDRHIEAEEQILFPDFERRTGMKSGPTVVMRAEHIEIRKWMAAAAAALDAQDPAGFRDALGQLRDVLEGHNLKEEQILYPMADEAAGDLRAQDDLVRQMQALL
jgi:uncharacterized protein (DUF2249 family)/hemerythrin-like domain-containing protein